MRRPPIVLLGLDCRTGLQSARLFAARGVTALGVADDLDSPYCGTRAVRGVLAAERFRAEPRAWLGRLVADGDGPPVLLPCSDEFVLWLSAQRDAIGDAGACVLPAAPVLSTLVEKSKLYRYAMQHGVAIPATRFLRSRADAEAAGRELRFPLALKPSLHTAAWLQATAGRKVLRIATAGELVAAWERVGSAVGELVAQEWIPGSDRQMYSLYSYRTRAGAVAAQMVVRKLRQWPPDVGVGSLAVQVDDPAVARLGLDLLSGLGFCGLSSVQIKKDAETGVPSVIEVNAGRPALNMSIAEFCGVEMQLCYYHEAAGLPLPEQRGVTRPGGKWLCVKTDLAAASALWRRGELDRGEWWRSVRGPKIHAVASWHDPVPFVLDLLRKTPGFGRPATRRARRGPLRGIWRSR